MIIDTSNKNILSYILCMLASQEQSEGQIYFDLNVEIFFLSLIQTFLVFVINLKKSF